MKIKTGMVAIITSISLAAAPVYGSTGSNPLSVQDQLSNTNDLLERLRQKQIDIQSKIDEANADLVDSYVQLDAILNDISSTDEKIAEIEKKISENEKKLSEAEELKQQQYEDMKIRIQYIYEQGGNAGWALSLLEQDNFSNFLNKFQEIQSLESADRRALQEYVDTIEKIDALKEKLLSQKTDLEDQKSKLETQKQDLELQQQNLNDLLEQKKQEADYNEAEIQEAQEQADQISALVQKQQEVEAAVSVEQETSSTTTVTTTEEETPSVVEEVPAQTENYTPATPQYSGSGQAIVSYAMQFLGCPYVWGGNSLTQGCDCSHFVWLVLRDSIGYSAGYCISDGFCYVGSPVNSLAEAQAGDIIVYPGHVAIYDGAGLIVEAKGSAYGITHDRPADHGAQILAIRRVV